MQLTGLNGGTKVEQKREVYQYDVPLSCQEEVEGFGKLETLGLIRLTAEEEILAGKRSQNSNYKTAQELAKQCLYMVNGQRVSLASNADEVWNLLPPKIRTLIITAYVELHTPSDNESADFMKSCKVIA